MPRRAPSADTVPAGMLSRRALLAAATAGVSALAAGDWGPGAWFYGAPQLPYVALGRAWLAIGGSRARALAFIDEVAVTSAQAGRTPGLVLEELRSADFRAGRTVVLEGWIVAEAEALLSAGLAIRQAGRA